jgi:hypothetical protein
MKQILLLVATALLFQLASSQSFNQLVVVVDEALRYPPTNPATSNNSYTMLWSSCTIPKPYTIDLPQNFQFLQVDADVEQPMEAIRALFSQFPSKAVLSSLIDKDSK